MSKQHRSGGLCYLGVNQLWVHTIDMPQDSFQWNLPFYMKLISFHSKASVVCSVTTAVFIDSCLKKLNVFSQHIGKNTNEYLNSAEQITRNWNLNLVSVLITSWDITWWCIINLLWKELMERMSEHTGLISSYQLLITAACTNTAARWKADAPEQLTGAHLYLDIAKSGYLFHGYAGGMKVWLAVPLWVSWCMRYCMILEGPSLLLTYARKYISFCIKLRLHVCCKIIWTLLKSVKPCTPGVLLWSEMMNKIQTQNLRLSMWQPTIQRLSFQECWFPLIN